jgi:hypothetical protein
MSEDIEIRLDNSFTSNRINLCRKQSKSSIINNLPIKLQEVYISKHKGENSVFGLELKKLKKCRFNSLKDNQKREVSNDVLYKKIKSLSMSTGKRMLLCSSLSRIDHIINNLNTEKAFFNNPKSYERAEKSFYYLHDLCDLYKIKEKKIVELGFEEIINMMLWKEGLEESQSNGGKNVKEKKLGNKGSMIHLIHNQNGLPKCMKFNNNSDVILLENLKGNFKNNVNIPQIKKNSVPCVETSKKMKKKKTDVIKLLKCQAEDMSLSDTFQSDKSDNSDISVSSSFLSEVSKESDSFRKKSKAGGKKKKVRRSNPTAKITGNPFKIQLINCQNSVKIREFKYLNS